jgi:hypothetical protein
MTALRTVYLPVVPGTLNQTLSWAEHKAPDSILDYTLDITSWLGRDSVVTASASVQPNGSGDITITEQPSTKPYLTVWLSDGNAGTNYSITFTVNTAAGKTLVETIYLFCQYLSPLPVTTPSVQSFVPAVKNPLTIVDNAVSAAAYALLPVITNVYTASGAIAVTDNVAVVNSTTDVIMTLGSGTVNGHEITIKRWNTGVVRLNAVIDGAQTTIVMQSFTTKETVTLYWSDTFTSWILK